MTTRVLLADDQALLRGMLARLVDSAPGMEVAGEAADGAEAVELARVRGADVVLMDIRMPGTDGIEATRAITADPSLAHVKVLILTTFEFDVYVAEALRAGARGFIGKGADPDELLAAIENVASGGSVLSTVATAALMARFQARAPAPSANGARLAELTPREREVLVLVASGLTNDDIAQRLQLSRHTVKTHVNRAMTKVGVSERAQLVTIAYESGLVEPGVRTKPLVLGPAGSAATHHAHAKRSDTMGVP